MNFRHIKESNSLHLEEQIQGVAGRYVPGTPGLSADDGMDTPGAESGIRNGQDLFGGFSSVTLHYDGEI